MVWSRRACGGSRPSTRLREIARGRRLSPAQDAQQVLPLLAPTKPMRSPASTRRSCPRTHPALKALPIVRNQQRHGTLLLHTLLYPQPPGYEECAGTHFSQLQHHLFIISPLTCLRIGYVYGSARLRAIGVGRVTLRPSHGHNSSSVTGAELLVRPGGRLIGGVGGSTTGAAWTTAPASGAGPMERRRRWLAADERLPDSRLRLQTGCAHHILGWPCCRAGTSRAGGCRAFAAVSPASILLPQYLALVLQATEGCSYNRCTFCDFYRDRPFRIKSADVAGAHQRARSSARSSRCASRSLADKHQALMGRLRLLMLSRRKGCCCSPAASPWEAYTVHRCVRCTGIPTDWQELRPGGCAGSTSHETGDDALLRFLRKPGTRRRD